jgi:tetratricopeptide (TPR) repeat protein
MRRLLLGFLLWLAACQTDAPEWQQWSRVAAARHEEADHLLDHGKRLEAGERLSDLVATAPRELNDVARTVLQDTYFRLARLNLEDHEPALALRQARAGLSLTSDDSLFRANLLVVQGAAYEALGQSAAALDSYQQALRINETLLHATLPSP